MNKGDRIRDFLVKNQPTDKKAAHAAFIKQSKLDVSSARFHGVWKEVFGDTTGSPLKSTVEIADCDADEDVKLTSITKIKYPASVLIPIKSGTPMDTLVSADGGTMPATITMAPGESGVGKTTVLLEYMGAIKKANPKKRMLFISSEMNDLHLFKYSKRISFDGVEILLLGDYKNPKKALEKIFKDGWDVILLDSMQDTIDKIVASGAMKPVRAESWLLSEMDNTRKGNNDRELYTAFYCTNHFTKGETYAGSTKIKHLADAMVLFRYDDLEETCIEYLKNRDGSIRKKLYFKISDKGCAFNGERFKRDETTKAEIMKVKENVAEKNDEWENFFPEQEKVVTDSTEAPVPKPKSKDSVAP
jgi:predicted ATP-dependent serine protease